MVRRRDSAAGRLVPAGRGLASGGLVCCLVFVGLLCLAAHGAEGAAPPAEEPIAAAIRSIVEAGRQPLLHRPDFSDRQDSTRQLYEAVNFHPLWLQSDTPTSQVAEILRTLSEADQRGLSPEDYDATRLREEAARFDSATPPTARDAAAFDTALTVCVLRYVSDAHLGRVPPRAVGFALDLEARPFDPVSFVSQLPAAAAPAQLLATLDPQFALFGPLMTALAHWRTLAARADFPQVPNLPKLHRGESHAGVAPLREFLRAIGDLPSAARAPKNTRVYDPDLVKAVKRFQERQGLGADGVIGEATLRQLQIPPAGRVRQIELALERLRWVPPPDDEAFLVVNLPEFRLRGYLRGNPSPALELRAVVGSASLDHETPVLHARMQYLVFRPYWDVPPAIAQKEILPDSKRDPAYFSRHHFEFHNGRIRQRPGDDNSLGLLKFVFPNPFHVYMHDTPSKRLFAKSRRDFSHGCIRVSNAAALAEFVLRGQGKWDLEGIDTSMKSGRNNHRVYLERPVGVYLLYSTAVVDEDGTTHFFEDIYGYDARLDTILAKGPPSSYPTPAPVTAAVEAE
ncbi:MAG TPA: L,D-transpeptidase family protein [Candidatus Margulisiibacteriota bacterium]|nr:L,D-transpeptidase family protein [Candidatus Margulisiibacteriota bacterium]